MILTPTYYQAQCDVCGAVDSGGEYAAWAEPDAARMGAIDAGWTEIEVRDHGGSLGPNVYIVRPLSGEPEYKECSILICEDHSDTPAGWCATCDADLPESGWTLIQPCLIQTCPSGHLNHIDLKEQDK